MDSLFELNNFITLLLVFIGCVLVLVELFAGVDSYFDLVLSGSALAIGGLIGFIVSSWPLALIISFILLLLYWILGRTYVHKLLATHTHPTNVEGLVGKQLTISRHNGKDSFVKVSGEEWRVQSQNQTLLALGDTVEIVAFQGVTLIVNKL